MSAVFREITATVSKDGVDVPLFTNLVEFVEIVDGLEPRQLPVAEEDFTLMQRNYLIAKYGRYFRRQDITVSRRAGESPTAAELKALVAAFLESVEIFNKTLPTRVSIDGSAVSVETIKAIQGDFMSMADQLSDINEKSAEVEKEQSEGSAPGTPAQPVGGDDEARVDTENTSPSASEGGVADAGAGEQSSAPADAETAPQTDAGSDDTVAAGAQEGVPA